MALDLVGLRYKRSYLGTYQAEVLFTRWHKGPLGGEFKYTYYRYHFDDANFYDELRSEATSKKRMKVLIRFIRNNAQYIMRHNDDEYRRRDGI